VQGRPFTLAGPALKEGDKAPDFNMVDIALKPVTLADTANQVRLISVVPSLDTPICDATTKRLDEEAVNLPGVSIIGVSMDLPFAQKRWCLAFRVDRVRMLSDHIMAGKSREAAGATSPPQGLFLWRVEY
jgi:thiol peroxidase